LSLYYQFVNSAAWPFRSSLPAIAHAEKAVQVHEISAVR
jgi:hypothetical protein